MSTRTVIITGLLVGSLCLVAQAANATDHRDGPHITNQGSPVPAGTNPPPNYNPYVTVDHIETVPTETRQKPPIGSLQSLQSVRQLELFSNSRGGDQGVGGPMGPARMGDGSVRPLGGNAPAPTATTAQPLRATTGEPKAGPVLYQYSATGSHRVLQPTPAPAAPTGAVTKPVTPQLNSFSNTAPAAGKAGGAVVAPNATIKRN